MKTFLAPALIAATALTAAPTLAQDSTALEAIRHLNEGANSQSERVNVEVLLEDERITASTRSDAPTHGADKFRQLDAESREDE